MSSLQRRTTVAEVIRARCNATRWAVPVIKQSICQRCAMILTRTGGVVVDPLGTAAQRGRRRWTAPYLAALAWEAPATSPVDGVLRNRYESTGSPAAMHAERHQTGQISDVDMAVDRSTPAYPACRRKHPDRRAANVAAQPAYRARRQAGGTTEPIAYPSTQEAPRQRPPDLAVRERRTAVGSRVCGPRLSVARRTSAGVAGVVNRAASL
jgi:hypothetical protein